MRGHRFAAVLLAAAASAGAPLHAISPLPRVAAQAAQSTDAASPAAADDLDAFITRLQTIVQAGDRAAYLALLTDDASRATAGDFAASEFSRASTRSVLRARDRVPMAGLPNGAGYTVQVDVLREFGDRARLATWRMSLRRVPAVDGRGGWAIADETRLSSLDEIYRLALDQSHQFRADHFTIASEDVELTLDDGAVFLANTDRGATGLVLMGAGTLHFHPAPATEQGQLAIFCGRPVLEAPFDAAFVRLNPDTARDLVAPLQPMAADPHLARRADDVFREESARSFTIDLGDLSADRWSLLPAAGDMMAEVRTRQYGTLTYAKNANELEDVGLFDRARRHTIALYASAQKLASRGRFYNEDDAAAFDIVHYDVDVASTPERQWLEGSVRMDLRVLAPSLSAVVLRLADSLAVRSVVSAEYGRLFAVRVLNQNTLVVNLPVERPRGSTLTLTVAYAGRLDPQPPDLEVVRLSPDRDPQGVPDDFPEPVVDPSYLYRNRSYWYPQGPTTDYTTASIRLSVPSSLAVAASGELEPGYPRTVPDADGSGTRAVYLFRADRPLRYLSFLVSRMTRAASRTVTFPPAPRTDGADSRTLAVSVLANPQQKRRAHGAAVRAGDIASFYESLLGDSPYPSLTIALVDSTLPGGHSPAYLAVLNQPVPSSRLNWHGDPAAFPGYPDFFLAHEIAHQWWGQAVGWRNYHEQWLSEGFAQYFAALYAQHERGDALFGSMLKQFRRWAVNESNAGPVYLGFRVGQLRDAPRQFRAVVYNKGAAVLHMLRRFVGDRAFFDGLRRFYRESRFKKAGTDQLREAMEEASGVPLSLFFDRWVYGSTLPTVRVTYQLDGDALLIHAEQMGPDLFAVPVSLTLSYADGRRTPVILALIGRALDQRVALRGRFKDLGVDEDDGMLANVELP